jgi:hypothetical protein
MAVTLPQAALLSQDPLQRGVIETFVQSSPILDRIPFMDIEGNSYRYNSEGTLPGVSFRGVNEAYVESTGTVNQASEGLVILGGDADVDTFIQKTRSDLNDQRAVQTAMKVKAASYKYQDAFFNGDVTVEPKGFDGLKKRLVGGQVIDAATNGMDIVAAGHDFLDALDALLALTDADVIYGNKKVIGKVNSVLRRLGGGDWITEAATGKRVPTYNGIPILDPGKTAAGADILPQTETVGTASDTGSLYAVKFGEDEGDGGVTGLTNGGVSVRDMGEVDDKPAFRTRIEFFTGLAVFAGSAAARLRGVK